MKIFYIVLIVLIVVSFITGVIVTIVEKKVSKEVDKYLRVDKINSIISDKIIVPLEVEQTNKDEPIIIANVYDKVPEKDAGKL